MASIVSTVAPFFIYHKDKCLVRSGNSQDVVFVDCDKNGTVDDKLWIIEDGWIKHLKSGYCLTADRCISGDISYLQSVMSSNLNMLKVMPCKSSKNKFGFHGNSICCKSGNNYNCVKPDVDPYKAGKMFLGAKKDKGLPIEREAEFTIKTPCCMGRMQTKRCGAYKPDKSTCKDEIETVCSEFGDSKDRTPAIVKEPVCTKWCKDNPSKCDSLKIKFCQKFPDHSLCDCINAAERPNVKSLFEKLPGTATGVPLPCFLQTRCGDTDLHNILVPESIRKLQANCPSNLVDMAQLVDCSGATCYNVGAEQEAKLEKTVQTGQSPSQQNTSQPNQTNPYKSKKAIIIYIMVFAFIMLIIAGIVAAQQYKSSGTQL